MTSTSQSGVSTITVYLRLNYDRQGADRDQHQGELGAEPAARRHAAAGADGPGRPDDRRDVHRLQQQGAGAQPDHRLPGARRAAQAAGGRGRADRGASAAPRISRCAPGSIRRSSRPTASPPPTWPRRSTDNDYISGLGNDQGPDGPGHLKASTACSSLEEFRNLVVKQQDGAIVRLSDVANVVARLRRLRIRGAASTARSAVYIGIQMAPAANLLDVIEGVRDVFPAIQAQLPAGAERRDRLRLDGIREQLDRGGRSAR